MTAEPREGETPAWKSSSRPPPTTSDLKLIWTRKFEALSIHDSDECMFPLKSDEGRRAVGRTVVWNLVRDRVQSASGDVDPRTFLQGLLDWANSQRAAQDARLAWASGSQSTRGGLEAWNYVTTVLRATIQDLDHSWDFDAPALAFGSRGSVTTHELKLNLAWKMEVAFDYETDPVRVPYGSGKEKLMEMRVFEWLKMKDHILAEPEDGTPREFVQNLMDFARLEQAGAVLDLSRRGHGFTPERYQLEGRMDVWNYIVRLLELSLASLGSPTGVTRRT
jgi:hypothetical protein